MPSQGVGSFAWNPAAGYEAEYECFEDRRDGVNGEPLSQRRARQAGRDDENDAANANEDQVQRIA